VREEIRQNIAIATNNHDIANRDLEAIEQGQTVLNFLDPLNETFWDLISSHLPGKLSKDQRAPPDDLSEPCPHASELGELGEATATRR
jgi:hypothetical protein